MSKLADVYSQLPWRFNHRGIEWHTAESLRALVEAEGLWNGQLGANGTERVKLGVRTFNRWTEDMEIKADQMLDLVPFFAGRQIRDAKLWKDDVLPSVQGFVAKHITPGCKLQLDIQAISSVAFLLGYLIESKLGVDVALLQSGTEWTVRPSLLRKVQVEWAFEDHSTDSGTDMAIIVSLAQDARQVARLFIDEYLSTVKHVFCATVQGGPNSQSLQDATEAFSLAGSLVVEARNQKVANCPNGRCHIFVAAPNAFSFYLGQAARVLGPISLYEYNFAQPDSCEYWASLFIDPTVCV